MTEFPVAIRKASEKNDVKFEYAVEVDGLTYPRRQTYVAGEVSDGDGPIPAKYIATDDNTKRGVWVGDEFREVDSESITAILEAGAIDGIEIEEFVALKSLPTSRIEASYYLVPQHGLIGAKPLRMLRDAMKAEKVAGLAKFCLKGTGGRQKLGAIYEQDGKVLLSVLTFAEEYRQSDESAEAIGNIEVSREHIKIARELVKAMTGEGTLLSEAVDETVAERRSLYEKVVDGDTVKPKVKPTPVTVSSVDDIVATMRASIAQAEKKPRKKVTA